MTFSAFFCRHAESTFNSRGDNSPDVPLSEAGEAQARRLEGHFSLVLCSPMRRAQQTLRLSRITYDRLETLPELREELNEGSDLLPGEGHDLLGESKASLTARVRRVGDRLRRESAAAASSSAAAGGAGFRVLVVSHLFLGWALFEACGGGGGGGAPHLANARIVPLPVRGVSDG